MNRQFKKRLRKVDMQENGMEHKESEVERGEAKAIAREAGAKVKFPRIFDQQEF